ncbi:MAG: hypothetical protein EHM45_21650 [Desulfobacteraceae bacterium]|nr:MAG: hypothetical protein EHM45_21650 [Desulfobacteraceae bacterium]
MRTILLTFMIFSLLFGSFAGYAESQKTGNTPPDEIFKKKIIGKWYTADQSSYTIASFEKGGAYREWAYENEKKQKLLHTLKGEWQIEGYTLYITFLNSQVTPPVLGVTFGATTEIKEITEFTDNVITYSDEDKYMKFYVRIKE